MIGTEFIRGQGLGNQLLCYVTARCAAIENHTEFGTVHAELLGNVVHSHRGMYFMDVDPGRIITPEEKAEMKVYQEKEERIFLGNSEHDITHGCYISGADPDLMKVPDGTLIQGNMQSEEYFGKYHDEICSWLRVLPEYAMPECTADDLCIINMRGGEYTSQPELYLDRRYYLRAVRSMKNINPSMRFFIVTEDPEAAHKVLPEFECRHFDVGRDYSAVHSARFLILSNSSFAVLPAFTSSELRFAIAPKYWARHNVSDGYWSSEQNIYSFAHYQDRSGALFTPEECRKELAEYKKTSPVYLSRGTRLEGEALRKAQHHADFLKKKQLFLKAVRKVERELKSRRN